MNVYNHRNLESIKPDNNLSDEDFNIVDNSGPQLLIIEQPEREIDQSTTNFHPKKQLKETEVYLAACGIFEEHHFQFVDVVHKRGTINLPCNELARVYKHPNNGMYYILYRPGKDNDVIRMEKANTLPLNYIMDEVNKRLRSTQNGRKVLKQAKKIFIVGESNTYYGKKIGHYIKGDLFRGTLTTVDSIDRDYDESYLDESKHLPHRERKIIKTGHQNMWLDRWTCSYHSIEAIERDITGTTFTPKKFKVTKEIIKKRFGNYQSGAKGHQIKGPLIEYDEVEGTDRPHKLIKVRGQIGGDANNCYITIQKLENALRKNVRDNQLSVKRIKNQKNVLQLRVYTENTIRVLEELGIGKAVDSRGRGFYEMLIQKRPVNTRPNKNNVPDFQERLFGIQIDVDGKTKSLDVSHLFSVEEIKHFRGKVNNKLPEDQQRNEDPVLKAIRKVNQYLKKRAQDTSGFFAIITNSYHGAQYYQRRSSFKNILKAINIHINDPKKLSRKILLDYIDQEAKQFEAGPFEFFKRSDYFKYLMDLHKELSKKTDDDFINIAKPVATYYQMYRGPSSYQWTMKKYIDSQSFFKSKKEEKYEARLEVESELYAAQYDMLSDADKDDFLNPKEQLMAEYHNMDRF